MPRRCPRAHPKACAQLVGERPKDNLERAGQLRTFSWAHTLGRASIWVCLAGNFLTCASSNQLPVTRVLSAPTLRQHTHHCTCLHRHLSATTCQLLHCDHPQLLLTLLYCDLPHQSADPCYLCLPNSAYRTTTTQENMTRQQPRGMAHLRSQCAWYLLPLSHGSQRFSDKSINIPPMLPTPVRHRQCGHVRMLRWMGQVRGKSVAVTF